MMIVVMSQAPPSLSFIKKICNKKKGKLSYTYTIKSPKKI